MCKLVSAFFLFLQERQCLLIIPGLFIKNSGSKIVSEYDQEIPQSQTADNPMAPQGRAAQPS